MSDEVSSHHVKREAIGKCARGEPEHKAVRRTKGSTSAAAQPNSELDERRRIEEELEQSEHDLAEAQRIARVGNWIWDFVNDEINWSTEFFRILGYDPESDEASKAAFLDRVHPEDRSFNR